MNQRDKAKDSFNVTRDPKFLEAFKILKNGVTSMMRKSQIKMFNEQINSKVKSSKDFYKAARKLNIIADKKLSASGNLKFT